MTPDVNVLVAAFHQDHAHHDVARAWLNAALQACLSGGRLRLLPMVCTSFVRSVTHAKVFTHPAPPADAIAFVDALLQSPGCDLPTLGTEWPAFAQLCSTLGALHRAMQSHHARLVR